MEITRRAVEGWTELVIEGGSTATGPSISMRGWPTPSARATTGCGSTCPGVTFISSAGIGVLVKFYKRLDAIKGALVIVRASAPVRTVLDMTRLTALLVDDSAATIRAR